MEGEPKAIRLVNLLRDLSATRKGRTKKELAEEHGIDKRTVERDLRDIETFAVLKKTLHPSGSGEMCYSIEPEAESPFSVSLTPDEGFRLPTVWPLPGVRRCQGIGNLSIRCVPRWRASCRNPEGLTRSGSQYYTLSANSGARRVGEAGASGFGTIRGYSLETSNVDITVELTNMIFGAKGLRGQRAHGIDRQFHPGCREPTGPVNFSGIQPLINRASLSLLLPAAKAPDGCRGDQPYLGAGFEKLCLPTHQPAAKGGKRNEWRPERPALPSGSEGRPLTDIQPMSSFRFFSWFRLKSCGFPSPWPIICIK